MDSKTIIAEAQQTIDDLYNLLYSRKDQSAEMQDITDVLLQVYKTLPTNKNPEALLNHLVNYIRSVSLAGRIHFPPDQETLIINLGVMGHRAGLNGSYMADFSDKSQFYSITEPVPHRH
ncbi:bacteriocin immunity protein [Furfurilactobacillus sp. WILCCON 0119]